MTARGRVEEIQWRHAEELLRIGTSVVPESGFSSRVDRDEKRVRAREIGAVVELHVLDAPIAVLWQRLAERNADATPGRRLFTRAELEEWAKLFEAPTPRSELSSGLERGALAQAMRRVRSSSREILDNRISIVGCGA